MRFKTGRIEKEWNSEKLDFRVRLLAIALDWYCRKYVYKRGINLTHIFRSNEEQREIYKNNAKFKVAPWGSTHEYWRAIDVGVNAFDEEERQRMCNFVNKRFNYYGSHNCCVYHNVGKGWHFHLQVDWKAELIVYK